MQGLDARGRRTPCGRCSHSARRRRRVPRHERAAWRRARRASRRLRGRTPRCVPSGSRAIAMTRQNVAKPDQPGHHPVEEVARRGAAVAGVGERGEQRGEDRERGEDPAEPRPERLAGRAERQHQRGRQQHAGEPSRRRPLPCRPRVGASTAREQPREPESGAGASVVVIAAEGSQPAIDHGRGRRTPASRPPATTRTERRRATCA